MTTAAWQALQIGAVGELDPGYTQMPQSQGQMLHFPAEGSEGQEAEGQRRKMRWKALIVILQYTGVACCLVYKTDVWISVVAKGNDASVAESSRILNAFKYSRDGRPQPHRYYGWQPTPFSCIKKAELFMCVSLTSCQRRRLQRKVRYYGPMTDKMGQYWAGLQMLGAQLNVQKPLSRNQAAVHGGWV